MNVNFISLPSDVRVPPSWSQTPKEQDKVGEVAQSYFANWKKDQLSNLSLLLKLGSVTLLIGAGISVFMLSIPGVVLCGAGLTICLIGVNAISANKW